MKTLILLPILPCLIWGIPRSSASEPVASDYQPQESLLIDVILINRLVAEAHQNHPRLHSARARLAAAELNAASVRSWEDPMFRVGGMAAASEGPMLEQEGDLLYALDQQLPLFGKAKRARRVAELEAASQATRADFVRQALQRDLIVAVMNVGQQDLRAAVGHQDLAVLEKLAMLAAQRYQARTGPQVDVLRLQNEVALRRDTLLTEEQQRIRARAIMNQLLGRKATDPWPPLVLPKVAPAVPYEESLVELSFKFDPQRQVLRSEVRRAEAAAEQTRRRRWPDVSLGVEARQYSGDGGIRSGGMSLGISLPWVNRNRYQRDWERDRALAVAADEELRDYDLEVRRELRTLTLDLDAARRQALLYRDEILPRSRQALDAARAAWISNAGSLTDVLETRRTWLDGEIAQGRAVAEQYSLLAELVLCCGLGDLESLAMLSSWNDSLSSPGANDGTEEPAHPRSLMP